MRGERYEFEIKSSPVDNPADNPRYVAVALSTDDKMGDDSVMECVPENGRISAYTSYTLPRPNLGVTRQGVVSEATVCCETFAKYDDYDFFFQPQNIIRLLDASYVDGVIYCRILREPRATILGQTFDLINNKYHLLVATGRSLKGECRWNVFIENR